MKLLNALRNVQLPGYGIFHRAHFGWGGCLGLLLVIGVVVFLACGNSDNDPPEVPGYDCSNPPEISGVVEYEGPKTGNYLVKTKPSARNALSGIAGPQNLEWVGPTLAVYKPGSSIASRDVIQGLSDMPGVLYVQEEGIASIQQVGYEPPDNEFVWGGWCLDASCTCGEWSSDSESCQRDGKPCFRINKGAADIFSGRYGPVRCASRGILGPHSSDWESAFRTICQHEPGWNGLSCSGPATRQEIEDAYYTKDLSILKKQKEILAGLEPAAADRWNLRLSVTPSGQPLAPLYDPKYTGQGVYVIVFDTGISPHREFGTRLLPGFDATGSSDTGDFNGHGSHVAGTAAGSTYGIAPGAWVVPVKVCSRFGLCEHRHMIRGLEWAIGFCSDDGVQCVGNMSIGGSIAPAVDDAICRAQSSGLPMAVAAGNESVDACSNSPARVAQALTVFAFNSNRQAALFTNFGACTDVGAPGVDVESVTGIKSGTSMASPHVAGALAQAVEESCGSLPCGQPDHGGIVLDHAHAGDLRLLPTRTPNRRIGSVPK